MPVCKDCGDNLPNIGEWNKHKKDCPKRPAEGGEPTPAASENQAATNWGHAIQETIKARGLDPGDFDNWVAVINESAKPAPSTDTRHLIPFAVCPHVQLLKPGTRVGLRIVGEIMADGVAVEEGRLL